MAWIDCPTCKTDPGKCTKCGGRGVNTQPREKVTHDATCPDCIGSGACSTCLGGGQVEVMDGALW